jgi:chemotaxis protein CheD
METENLPKKYFLTQSTIFFSIEECLITTVLGSCISVCIWDAAAGIGGMNHYMLPLWNGEGLPTPRYGNIAIPRLVEKMMHLGCRKKNLRAKVFGGADILVQLKKGDISVGSRNIIIAEDLLAEKRIPIVSSDTGGNYTRTIQFNTSSGDVFIKRFRTGRFTAT